VVTATQLRQDIYQLLDAVIETGEPLEILRNGRRLKIVLDEEAPGEEFSRLARMKERPGVLLGAPDEIVSIDWTERWNLREELVP
jgi:hypothetical protein